MKVRVKFTVDVSEEAAAAISTAVGAGEEGASREQVKDWIRDNGISGTPGITVAAEKAPAAA